MDDGNSLLFQMAAFGIRGVEPWGFSLLPECYLQLVDIMFAFIAICSMMHVISRYVWLLPVAIYSFKKRRY